MSKIAEIHLDAVESTLQGILDEVKVEDYTTISEVLGSINSSLDAVKALRKEYVIEASLEGGNDE